ncbi:hypothetical protein JHL21_00275 [Devosia sp. WQ 349]|uniref:DUF6194 family protein n=1 Tax=Devosia sp. WQ 349K1 TaxID=2800329 RepID=UPI0019048880|nr:DUF6194 family protein [Devosia sp. WQ 349K1]MBK1792928.1 hypothetical protein [Devosia sp. WQ 349K1]
MAKLVAILGLPIRKETIMPVSIEDIANYVAALPDVRVDDTTADVFFFKGTEQNFPFATVVTHDQPYDDQSNLDRQGLFRLNIQTDRDTFERLFPGFDKSTSPAESFDLTAIDTLFPHPVYAKMRWVSVITPDHSWPRCQELLRTAHGQAK